MTTFAINSSEAGAPLIGAIPRLAYIWQNRQLSAATTMSPASIISMPTVKTIPVTAVTMGFRHWFAKPNGSISDLRALAATIKARWICEQAHQQLKEERALSLCDKGRRVLSGCKVHVRV